MSDTSDLIKSPQPLRRIKLRAAQCQKFVELRIAVEVCRMVARVPIKHEIPIHEREAIEGIKDHRLGFTSSRQFDVDRKLSRSGLDVDPDGPQVGSNRLCNLLVRGVRPY